MFRELEDVVHQCGARLVFLPSYSPELNPTEFCFGQLKRWIKRNANLLFPLYSELILDTVMPTCTKDIEHGTLGLYGHCGCNNRELMHNFIEGLQNRE